MSHSCQTHKEKIATGFGVRFAPDTGTEDKAREKLESGKRFQSPGVILSEIQIIWRAITEFMNILFYF